MYSRGDKAALFGVLVVGHNKDLLCHLSNAALSGSAAAAVAAVEQPTAIGASLVLWMTRID